MITKETETNLISRANFKQFGFGQKDVNVICSALHRYVPYAVRRKIVTEMTRKTSGSYQQITWAIHWNTDDAINTLETLCKKSEANKTLFQNAIEKINHFKSEKANNEAIAVAI